MVWRFLKGIEEYTGLEINDYSEAKRLILSTVDNQAFRKKHGFWINNACEYYGDKTLYRWWKDNDESQFRVIALIEQSLSMIPEEIKNTWRRGPVEIFWENNEEIYLEGYSGELGRRVSIVVSKDEAHLLYQKLGAEFLIRNEKK